jgi:hypothetical protein
MREWSRTRARPASSRRNTVKPDKGGGWMAKYGAQPKGLGEKPAETPSDDGERKLEL